MFLLQSHARAPKSHEYLVANACIRIRKCEYIARLFTKPGTAARVTNGKGRTKLFKGGQGWQWVVELLLPSCCEPKHTKIRPTVLIITLTRAAPVGLQLLCAPLAGDVRVTIRLNIHTHVDVAVDKQQGSFDAPKGRNVAILLGGETSI